MGRHGTVLEQIRQNISLQIFHDLSIPFLLLYLIGLILYNFPPLIIGHGDTSLLRPDWLLSIPLLIYVFAIRREIQSTNVTTYAAIFAFSVFVSGVMNSAITTANFVTIYIQLIYIIILFFALMSLKLSEMQFRIVARFWLILIFIISLYGLYQAVALNSTIPLLTVRGDLTFAIYHGYYRPMSVFSEPSNFGRATLSGLALLIPAIVYNKPLYFSRPIQKRVFSVLVISFIAAGSLGAYITGVLTAGILLIWLGSYRDLAYGISFATVAGILIFIGGSLLQIDLFRMIIVRVNGLLPLLTGNLNFGAGSSDIRMARWIVMVKAWMAKPMFGIGAGQLSQWVITNDPSVPFSTSKLLIKTHGAWLQVLGLTGGIGFLLFASTWLSVLGKYFREIANLSVSNRPILISGMALVILQLVGWTMDHSFISTFEWALIGIPYGYIISVTEGTDHG